MGIQTSISLPVWGIHNLKFFRASCHFPDFCAYFPLSTNFVHLIFHFPWIMRGSFYSPIQSISHKLQSHHNAGI